MPFLIRIRFLVINQRRMMEPVSQEHREELRNWIANVNPDELDDEKRHLYDMLTMDRSGCGKFKKYNPSFFNTRNLAFIIIFLSLVTSATMLVVDSHQMYTAGAIVSSLLLTGAIFNLVFHLSNR